jgi:hypothetical protein
MPMAEIRLWRNIAGPGFLHSSGSGNAEIDAVPTRRHARRTGCRGE